MFTYRLTDEVELRMLEPRHAEEFFMQVDRNRDYLRRYLSWVDRTQTVDDAHMFLRTSVQWFADNGAFETGIWHHSQFVGAVGMMPINWGKCCVEIGYWIGEAYQGKGLITMTCQAVIDHIFTNMQLHRVEIRAVSENVRSRAIPERLGMHHDGTLREEKLIRDKYYDHEVYSVLHHEWKRSLCP